MAASTVITASGQPERAATFSFTPDEAGYYVIDARVTDDAGRPVAPGHLTFRPADARTDLQVQVGVGEDRDPLRLPLGGRSPAASAGGRNLDDITRIRSHYVRVTKILLLIAPRITFER